jgi:sugar phosphate isomerase/epimerase
MKIAICNEIFQGWPIEKIFEYVAELGYDGVEIAPLTLGGSISEISQQRRADIRRDAEKSGVEVIGLHSLLKKPEGLSLNHPDEGVRKRTRENITASTHLCADLGGKMLNLGFSRQIAIQEGWGYDESWIRTRDTFGRYLLKKKDSNL